MRNRSGSSFFFILLFLIVNFTGCTQMEGVSNKGPETNETALAIEIALNNSSVRSSLTGSWTIIGVNLNASSTFRKEGKWVTLRTPNVMFEMESRIVHVRVDPSNRSVVGIYEQPKRSPMPGMRAMNNSSGGK